MEHHCISSWLNGFSATNSFLTIISLRRSCWCSSQIKLLIQEIKNKWHKTYYCMNGFAFVLRQEPRGSVFDVVTVFSWLNTGGVYLNFLDRLRGPILHADVYYFLCLRKKQRK